MDRANGAGNGNTRAELVRGESLLSSFKILGSEGEG